MTRHLSWSREGRSSLHEHGTSQEGFSLASPWVVDWWSLATRLAPRRIGLSAPLWAASRMTESSQSCAKVGFREACQMLVQFMSGHSGPTQWNWSSWCRTSVNLFSGVEYSKGLDFVLHLLQWTWFGNSGQICGIWDRISIAILELASPMRIYFSGRAQ